MVKVPASMLAKRSWCSLLATSMIWEDPALVCGEVLPKVVHKRLFSYSYNREHLRSGARLRGIPKSEIWLGTEVVLVGEKQHKTSWFLS